MKTWIIVAIIVVLLIAIFVVYKSLSSKATPPPTIVQAPASSNIFDFASAALPQLITAFGKNKPAVGIGATAPATTINAQGQPTGSGWINFNDVG